MTPPAELRALRAARSGAATALAVLVALAAHVAGGGVAPPPSLLAGVLGLAWPVALLLIGRRPRLWRQAAVVGVAQLLLHLVFALGVPAGGATSGGGMAGMHAVPMPLPLAPVPAGPVHADQGMWLAHAAAWLLTIAAWRWGEAALRRTARRLPLPRALLLAPPPPVAAVRVPVPAAPQRLLPEDVVRAARLVRGPPAAA